MLNEIKDTRQIPGEGYRRWFRDEELDLILWYGDSNTIEGFQLCYDKSTRERALTWRRPNRYDHHAIDSGEVPGTSRMSPVLVADGLFDAARIEKVFASRSDKLPKDIAGFVSGVLNGYPGT